MPKIETIVSPALFHLYEKGIEHKNIVVIDVLRATTTICVALANGATEIIPVGTPEEALLFKKDGYLVAAERSGKTVEGFTLGNSPQEYSAHVVNGKKIAFTTTNGTRALQLCRGANKTIIASFLNAAAVAKMLAYEEKNVILFCSGWKDKLNLEDTILAGKIAQHLLPQFELLGDASNLAADLYTFCKDDIAGYLQKASHVQRFKSLHVESDLEVCLQPDTINIVSVYKNGIIA
jgi:2-phosphosulfolactate phosphatase